MNEDALDTAARAYGLDPVAYRSEVSQTLQLAGLYLLGYQLVEHAIVQGTKDFFLDDVTDPASEYQKLLSRVPDKQQNRAFRAGVLFLSECSGLTQDEADELVGLLRHRNDISHRMPQIVFDSLKPDASNVTLDLGRLHRVPAYLYKLSNFWANVTMDTDDEAYDDEARRGAVAPIALMFGALYYRLTGKMPDVPASWHGAITGSWEP